MVYKKKWTHVCSSFHALISRVTKIHSCLLSSHLYGHIITALLPNFVLFLGHTTLFSHLLIIHSLVLQHPKKPIDPFVTSGYFSSPSPYGTILLLLTLSCFLFSGKKNLIYLINLKLLLHTNPSISNNT